MDGQTWLYTGIADRPEVRSRLLAGHLARELGCSPDAIVLGRDRFGKPFLAAPAAAYWFNLSACGGLVLVAGSHGGPVGADVETLARCRPVWEDAAREFAPAERARLAGLAPAERPLAFARLWTAKEAVLKARGIGIVNGLVEPDLSHLGDLSAPPPWNPARMKVGDDHYAVTWYTLPIDEARVVAARAESSSNPGIT
ncbi:phosphopantetheinyl transferase [Paramagnetospirillum caucaseum]|uniref:Phosphopantetheinyl transferase n=1 Tax=Paramagnetospirillum caucaseum TaxID=1244869 RepID=M2ZX36_9PROT|nr:4'-phosphopantetheinyl transferase superfamily protein [Paramagnetospirillum caucaseum]EME71977.1 phosphopantetheinyl transferase [Paramagnetospirillum caucaseum]